MFFCVFEVKTAEKKFLIFLFYVCNADMSVVYCMQSNKLEPERSNIMNTQQNQIPKNAEKL